jgi:hypothetical protein
MGVNVNVVREVLIHSIIEDPLTTPLLATKLPHSIPVGRKISEILEPPSLYLSPFNLELNPLTSIKPQSTSLIKGVTINENL